MNALLDLFNIHVDLINYLTENTLHLFSMKCFEVDMETLMNEYNTDDLDELKIKLGQSIAEYITTKKIDNGLKTAVRIAKENRDIETRCMKLSLDLQNHFEHMFQEYNNR